MKRYEEPSDAIPHELNVLVCSETTSCFGEPFPAILDAVRQRLTCDKLFIEEYYHDLDNLTNHELLVQHGIWLIHDDCLRDEEAYPELHHYLETESYPDGTVVVICLEENEVDTARSVWDVRKQYDDTVAVSTDRAHLVGYLSGVCNVVNPCSPAGLEFILDWNNDVCDDLEIM